MKKALLAVVLPAAVLLLVGAGCEVTNTDVETSSTTSSSSAVTAKTAFADAESFVEADHADAVLVGFNNHEASFVSNRELPASSMRSTDGTSPYWAFVFAKDSASLDDNRIEYTEAVAAIYDEGTVTYDEDLTSFDIDTDIEDGAGVGAANWTVDSDEALEAMLDDIDTTLGEEAPDVMHVQFNMNPWVAHFDPWIYDVSIFTSETAGYNANVDPKTGEVTFNSQMDF